MNRKRDLFLVVIVCFLFLCGAVTSSGDERTIEVSRSANITIINYTTLNFTNYTLSASLNFNEFDATNISNLAVCNNTHFGCEDNYVEIDDNGYITLHGDAVVRRHLMKTPQSAKLPTENFPAVGLKGLYATLDFDRNTDECAYIVEHMPSRWAEGTNLTIEMDWTHETEDNGTVVWSIEYNVTAPNGTIAEAGEIIAQTSRENVTQDTLERTVFDSEVDVNGYQHNDILAMKLCRDADNVADTLDEDARAINLHIVFIMDKLGEEI